MWAVAPTARINAFQNVCGRREGRVTKGQGRLQGLRSRSWRPRRASRLDRESWRRELGVRAGRRRRRKRQGAHCERGRQAEVRTVGMGGCKPGLHRRAASIAELAIFVGPCRLGSGSGEAANLP